MSFPLGRTHQRFGSLVGLVLAGFMGSACAGRSGDATGGQARVAVSGSALTGSVASVTLTIGPGDGPTFTPIVEPLTQSGSQWTVFVAGIPAGPGRSFAVAAKDAGGNVLLSGSAKADVVAGGTATVVITLNGSSGPIFSNQAPVMDYLTASQTVVDPGGTVRLGASAHDPDPGDTITYQWAATCGSFDQAQSSTAVWTAPGADGSCQLSLTVADNHGASVVAFLVVAVGKNTGDVMVTVDMSTDAPVINAMTILVKYGDTSTEGNLTVTATDPSGGALSYEWTSTCGGITFDSSAPNSDTSLTFTYTDVTHACSIEVTVTNGSGGKNTGTIVIPPKPSFNLAPVITNAVQPNADLTNPLRPVMVTTGSAVSLGVNAYDPEGQALSFSWTASAGTLDPSVNQNTSPGSSTVVYHVPSPLPPGTTVTVKVSDPLGAYATHVFYFETTTTDLCAGVTCTPSDKCHNAGTCDATTGLCSAGTPVSCPAGQTCDLTDGTCKVPPNPCTGVTCTASDLCHVAGVCDTATGTCSAQTPVQCPSGQACDLTTGQCKVTNLCVGVTCTASDLCHVAGTCDPTTGVCSAQTPVSCPSGQACDLTTGQCAATNLCAGVTCTASDLCHVAGTCDPTTGLCSAQAPVSCPTGQTCDLTTGQCTATTTVTVPTWAVAKDLQISGPVGLAMDTAGNTYLAGAIYSTSPISFDGHSVASGGDADIFLAQYNTSGVAQWAVGYGDGAGANPQIATGAAATADGTLAVIGSFSGTFSIGTGNLNSSNVIDFVAFLRQADGTGITAKQFNDGFNGALKAVGANPNDSTTAHGNRIAVCGLANGGTPALPTSGAVAATGNDIIIGAFKSDGTQLWGSQYSSAGTFNEECDSVAVDDNGDVWAIGSTAGATLNFGGATSALTGPGNSNRKYLWIAKFNGATGAPLLSAIFSGTGQVTPNSTGGTTIAIDPAGDVVAGGQVVGAVTFGATTLTSAGSADAWVAKFSGTNLVPVWAERLGSTKADNVNGLTVDYQGDVVATGAFNLTASISGSTASSSTITASGTTAADAFVWKLNGVTGGTDFVAGYGDAATQTGDAIVANRFAAADQVSFAGTLNSAVTFPAPIGTVTAVGATDVFLAVGQIK